MIVVIHVQQGNSRANGCCASRGREVVSTKVCRAHGIVRCSLEDAERDDHSHSRSAIQ